MNINETQYFARGGFSSGGRSSSFSSSRSTSSASRSTSTRSSTTSKPSTTTSKTTASKPVAAKPKPITAQKASTKPGTTIKTANGKTVKSSTSKPAKPGYHNEKGIVGANGYTPRFNNYSAPAGSVVYYHDTSFVDYLPWIYLFSHNNPATPQGQTATVVQPDGKQIQAKPVAQGTDGMAIFNWFLLVLIILAIIGGIVWGVNKLTSKKTTAPRSAW